MKEEAKNELPNTFKKLTEVVAAATGVNLSTI
jgi:hypothetical protein